MREHHPPTLRIPLDSLALFEAIPGNNLLIEADPEHFIILSATPGYSVLTGKSRETFIGQGIFEVFPSNASDPGDRGEKNLRASFLKVISEKKTHQLPADRYDVRDEHGNFIERYWHANNIPLFNNKGEVAFIIHSVSEITNEVIAKRNAEKIKGIQQAHDLFMQAPISIYMLKGEDLIIEMANDPTLKHWDRGKEVIGKPLLDVLPELKEQGYDKYMHEVLKTGQSKSFYEAPIAFRKGDKTETRYFNFIYKPYYHGDPTTPSGIITAANDLTEKVLARQEAEKAGKEAEKQKRLYDTVIGSTPDLIYVFDLNYHFIYANKALLEMWGKSWQEAIGKRLIENGYEPWHAEMHEREIDEVVANRKSIRGEVSFPHATQGRRVYDYIFVPVINEIGDVEAVAGTTRDITDIKQAEEAIKQSEASLQKKIEERTEELEKTVKELQRSNANLEEFAYAASHDLKEPIRKIHYFTEQLKEQFKLHVTEQESRSFSRIEKATERMAALIDDLLIYSHVSQRPHEKESIDLNAKIHVVLEDLELDIQAKGAKIHVGRLPVVQGYRRQLQQLFQNLIGNALKYSKKGTTPIIDISASEVTENGNKYHLISIRDNGIGFEQQYADKIFQMFSRLHGKSEYSGTGVGLSIVKKVVENHNGMIRVASEPDMGSTFNIYFPLE
jgi:PAS domain S-box-containing protein